MGNVLLDLDMRFGRIQFNYYAARGRRDFEEAAYLLYDANSNLPPDAAIKDMYAFKFVRKGNRDKRVEQAHEYCARWAPLVWRSIAVYAERVMKLNQD